MGERIYEQDTCVLAAVETVYGTDAAPTAAANAMRVKADLTLHDGDQEDLEFDAGRGGSKGAVQRNKRVTGSMTAYVAGSGAVDTPPAIGPLLQMCGLKPTITATEKVVYAPVSTNHDSCTVHVFRGKLKHPMLGARSSVDISLGPDALPKFTFNSIIGLFADPTQVASFQNADFSQFENPLVTDPVSITKMQLFGQDINMSSMTFKLGNTVTYRAVTNDESVQITQRRPQVEITFEEPLINDFNWWNKVSTYGTLAYQIGEDVTDAGQIFELAIPNLQLRQLNTTMIDGISHLVMTLDVVPTARDNDFEMIFR
ncbi:phage tail tube protein [Rheinheimera maricola]|uniref:Viral coat protein P2 N-terminal domain-containing protein n=1 Tax=Rheinheimera maricola TaxID=2793282 RepID=A0ABS7X9Z9_9GAMM|nr:phage tail tube protein [Rheinheimera maricola]MBZ9612141.1 hypothetical protein [Rheinheimera maricola]